MSKKRKSSPNVIKNATTMVVAFRFLVRAVGVSLAGTLFAVALVNIVAVVSVAKCKYGEPPSLGDEGGRYGNDPEWWLLGGATGASLAAGWIAVFVHLNAPRYRTTGKIALGVLVAALGAVIFAGDIDLDPLLELMNATI